MVVVLLLSVLTAGGLFAVYMVKNDAKKDQEAVRTAVGTCMEGFCAALDGGDVEGAKQFCSDAAKAVLDLDDMNAEAYRQVLIAGLGLSEADMSEETRTGLDSLINTMRDSVFVSASYDTANATVKKSDKGVYRVTMDVTMTGCGNLNAIDYSGAVALSNVMIANYTTDNQATLMDICDTAGIEAVRNTIKKEEVGNLLSGMNAKVLEQSNMSRSFTFSFLVTVDEDGNVTSVIIDGAEEKLGNEGAETQAE